jgi:hypothetical protein
MDLEERAIVEFFDELVLRSAPFGASVGVAAAVALLVVPGPIADHL